MCTTFYGGNYHPLTALSNAVEYHFLGLDPKPYHVVNVVLHLLNVALVFLVVGSLAGRFEPAVLAALFFAIHPMHVESVAWISERKDVLYSFFYLLAWLSYIQHTRKGKRFSAFLVLSLFLFACSLSAKSMAVTLPVVLILTDYLIKKKITVESLIEKVPFFLLSLFFGVVALRSQTTATQLAPRFPFAERILFSAYGVVEYVFKFFAPVKLSAFHPYPEYGTALTFEYYFALAILLVAAVLIFRTRRLKREFVFGVAFFLVALGPVSQLLPVGGALTAERYTYLPYLGIAFIVASFYTTAADRLKAGKKSYRFIPLLVVMGFASVFSILTYRRLDVWKDSVALYTDVIEKYPDSSEVAFAYSNRGFTKDTAGDYGDALADYDQAIRVNPEFVPAWFNRGFMKAQLRDYASAIADFDEAIRRFPGHYEAYNDRGSARNMLGDYANAMTDFTEAIRLKPDFSDAYVNRGSVQRTIGMNEAACKDWRTALSLGNPQARSLMQTSCF